MFLAGLENRPLPVCSTPSFLFSCIVSSKVVCCLQEASERLVCSIWPQWISSFTWQYSTNHIKCWRADQSAQPMLTSPLCFSCARGNFDFEFDFPVFEHLGRGFQGGLLDEILCSCFRTFEEQLKIIERIKACNHPKISPGNKSKMEVCLRRFFGPLSTCGLLYIKKKTVISCEPKKKKKPLLTGNHWSESRTEHTAS